ncbi:DUF6777 domain-containing protein [Streptomyces sp. NPDC019396]|uniref:DUF6777 domain-containing protein n=1 Tax=Streptomyces sp. NPDC019396 TaxID=3154687 RepID=UPI0033C8E276
MQPANETGPDPFTASTANGTADAPPAALPSAATATRSPSGTFVRGVDGATPGLYGGSRNTASCDTGKQVRFLAIQPEKNRAFASALGIQPTAVAGYLRSMTSLRLRLDTRVTNHGYQDGKATSYQAVLQAGTAVLVDDRGVPRVRCACGNPLTPPVEVQRAVKRTGKTWSGFDQARVVIVQPAPRTVDAFVVLDFGDHAYFSRDRADTGTHDKPVAPPKDPTTPTEVPSAPEGGVSSRPDGSTPPDRATSPGETASTASCAPGSGTAGCPSVSPPAESPAEGSPPPDGPSTRSPSAGVTGQPETPPGSAPPVEPPPGLPDIPDQQPAPESRPAPDSSSAPAEG